MENLDDGGEAEDLSSSSPSELGVPVSRFIIPKVVPSPEDDDDKFEGS